ncbi:hypothetical protein DEJ50_31140 [Streptomyces venezuelae]|uniref:Uncharacterized protein n=1 Tax=Streptomyces venezuelae TaxID=54571 RepID=A0A5P2DBQ5_STRVZ|nr:hypothetical protein DEJ50_31140 [Streptomyces venezuelae]
MLHRRPELADLAAYPFNFDVRRKRNVEEVRLASDAPLRITAGDDTGGTFYLCAGGEVLYGGSEGESGLLGESVSEALETIVGLGDWEAYADLDLSLDDAELAAYAAEVEEMIAEHYGPSLDADRDRLLAGLGLRRLPVRELAARLQRALLRTEPEFLLLNAEEGLAYRRLDELPRPALYETVLAPARADLDLLREGAAGPEILADAGRRAGVLRAAQYDRRPGDRPVLRALVEQEARFGGDSSEFRLAAVLLGRYGEPADHALLRSLAAEQPDLYYGLGGSEFPEQAQELRGWAASWDDSEFGEDPREEPEVFWARLAGRQGRTETARAALIRLLDATGPADRNLIGELASAFREIGDLWQAARARYLHASLLDEPFARGSAFASAASAQRCAGEVAAAWKSLRRAVATLDGPPAVALSGIGWDGLALGATVAEEHFRVAHAAAAAGLHPEAEAAWAAGTALLARLPGPLPASLREAAAAAGPAVAPSHDRPGPGPR